MSAYPGLDADMLPLALIVVILGGVGSLVGAFVGSFITGFVYTFGVALLPDLAYVILFLPMILVIAFRPRGLFGKFARMKRWIALVHRLLRVSALVAGEYYINLASQIFIFAVFASSINLLLGYGGLPTLGHAAYLGRRRLPFRRWSR